MAPLIAVGLLAAGIWHIAAEAAVFGRDERRPLTDQSLKAAIGRLQTPTSGAYCTAFCVAPNIIATASHCLFGTRAVPRFDGATITFARDAAAHQPPATIAGRTIANTRQNIVSGTEALRTSPPIDANRDWALVRLSTPACGQSRIALSGLDSEAVAIEARLGRVGQAGYHRDLAPVLAVNPVCAPFAAMPARGGRPLSRDFERADSIFFHTCDTGAGASGSPMIRRGGSGIEAVAMNVGTYVRPKSLAPAGTTPQTPAGEPVANAAVLTSLMMPGLRDLADRDLVETPVEVRALERRLRALHHYRGPILGRASPALIAAVERYERASGLPVTGLLRRGLASKTGATTGKPAPR